MKIQNPTNGFVRVESNDYVLVCDPWLSKGIFDGAWMPYPATVDEGALLDGVTHSFISHIHEDHYDVATLDKLSRDVHLLVPDVYPNHLMAGTLKQMGFRQPSMLALEQSVEVAPGLGLEVVPRMNAYGQELEQYEDSDVVSLVIDTGVIVTVDGFKLVFLADNVPYQPADAGEAIEHMKGCDLLAFSYNGAASDYPLCYDNLTDEEKLSIAEEREAKRETVNRALIEMVQPKALVPYSSEFALRGPMARAFAKWCSGSWWADKQEVVRRYRAHTGLPVFALSEGDVLTLEPEGAHLHEAHLEAKPLSAVVDELYSEIPNTRALYPPVEESETKSLIERATEHMFQRMDRHRLKSEWILAIALDDPGWRPVYVDLRERSIDGSPPADRPVLTCKCEANYLAALLRGSSHWNNAMISFNLHWERRPNVFERGLYDALNFFHRESI